MLDLVKINPNQTSLSRKDGRSLLLFQTGLLALSIQKMLLLVHQGPGAKGRFLYISLIPATSDKTKVFGSQGRERVVITQKDIPVSDINWRVLQ